MHLIEVKNAIKTYQTGEESFNALNSVSLNVDKGEFVAIMGTSGSGKSTFMNMLGTLDKPTSGSYFLDGEDMLKLVEIQLRKAYENACRQLVQNGQISADICERALTLSNFDTMNAKPPKFNTYYYTVCALVFAIFTMGMNVFCYDYPYLDILNTFAIVALSMYMGFYIGVKKFTN